MITLKTLPQATPQEVFNQVKNHLLKQNKRSVCDRFCAYRGPEGAKCAAGCLIGDDEYNSKMEKYGSWTSLIDYKIVPDTHRSLICSLQAVHDCFDVDNWPENLIRVAKEYGLKY